MTNSHEMTETTKKRLSVSAPRNARCLLLVGALATTAVSAAPAPADGNDAVTCLQTELATAPDDLSVKALRERCATGDASPAAPEASPDTVPPASLIGARIQRERDTPGLGALLTPHRRNYFMPFSYASTPNQAPFDGLVNTGNAGELLDNAEAKFQLSIKTTLADGLITDQDSLQFGFTTVSFWQAYNSNISAPFRETNYEPEIFWATPLKWRPAGVDASVLMLGLSHQSNGQSGTLSRSWNRVYANIIWERGDFVFSLKPWWRVPENAKQNPTSSRGDDNPDIEDYMGHFEFTTIYQQGAHEFSGLLRNNLRSPNRGAIQLDWTFPLWKRLRGYVQYFNGYGESLIDYNAKMERLGVGILLTDLLGPR